MSSRCCCVAGPIPVSLYPLYLYGGVGRNTQADHGVNHTAEVTPGPHSPKALCPEGPEAILVELKTIESGLRTPLENVFFVQSVCHDSPTITYM